MMMHRIHIHSLLEDKTTLDDIIAKIKPDVLITSVFILLETLIFHYRYRIPQVVLSPMIRHTGTDMASSVVSIYFGLPAELAFALMTFFNKANGKPFEKLPDIITPMAHMPELTLCPEEFLMPKDQFPENVFFIEASIRKDALSAAPSGQLPAIPDGKKIIFASLGSQAFRFKAEGKGFYQKMLEVMRGNLDKDWYAVLAVGSEFPVEEFGEIPANVAMLTWAPQIEVLNIASLAITHGGLGTVKECIFFGVPMIALPLGRDQFRNAEHIRHHKLGLELDVKNFTADELGNAITHVLTDESIEENIKKDENGFP